MTTTAEATAPVVDEREGPLRRAGASRLCGYCDRPTRWRDGAGEPVCGPDEGCSVGAGYDDADV